MGNAKGTVIKPENFSKTLNEILQMYGENCASVTIQILEKTADDSVKTLKATRWGWTPRSGKYERSFRSELRKTRLGATATIYSRAPHYRLTHLLEKGHRTLAKNPKKKKYSAKYSHWADVEKQAIAEFEEELLRGLTERGLT